MKIFRGISLVGAVLTFTAGTVADQTAPPANPFLYTPIAELPSQAEGTTVYASNDTSQGRVYYPDFMGDAPEGSDAPTSTETSGSWAVCLALLLPLLLGLGIIEATLLHATILLLAGAYKGRVRRLVPWHPTMATVLALAWATQMALVAGILGISMRMRSMIRDGTMADADHFSAFSVSLDTYVLGPVIVATPVVAFIYWTVLTLASKIKKAKMKEANIAIISNSVT